MEKIIKFYNFKRKGINYVIVILLNSVLTFWLSMNSKNGISKGLDLLASILYIASAIYSMHHFIKEYKNIK